MKRWYYTAGQIAPLLHWDAHYIRIMARKAPDKLPFPTELRMKVSAAGKVLGTSESRVRIPKKPFDDWFIAQGGDRSALEGLSVA